MFKRQEPNKDILEGLKYLSETNRKLHEIRQKYEWRIVFAVLTFYILAMAALLGLNQSGAETTKLFTHILDSRIYLYVGFFIISIISLASILLLLNIHRANDKNKKIAENAEKEIANYLNVKDRIYFKVDLKKRKLWAPIWQSTIIIIFASLLMFIIYTLANPTKNKSSQEDSGECIYYIK